MARSLGGKCRNRISAHTSTRLQRSRKLHQCTSQFLQNHHELMWYALGSLKTAIILQESLHFPTTSGPFQQLHHYYQRLSQHGCLDIITPIAHEHQSHRRSDSSCRVITSRFILHQRVQNPRSLDRRLDSRSKFSERRVTNLSASHVQSFGPRYFRSFCRSLLCSYILLELHNRWI
jgi:hypothetical protein